MLRRDISETGEELKEERVPVIDDNIERSERHFY